MRLLEARFSLEVGVPMSSTATSSVNFQTCPAEHGCNGPLSKEPLALRMHWRGRQVFHHFAGRTAHFGLERVQEQLMLLGLGRVTSNLLLTPVSLTVDTHRGILTTTPTSCACPLVGTFFPEALRGFHLSTGLKIPDYPYICASWICPT